jgi:hypothetical protein
MLQHHSTLRRTTAASLVVAEQKQPLVRSHSGVITGNPLTTFFHVNVCVGQVEVQTREGFKGLERLRRVPRRVYPKKSKGVGRSQS